MVNDEGKRKEKGKINSEKRELEKVKKKENVNKRIWKREWINVKRFKGNKEHKIWEKTQSKRKKKQLSKMVPEKKRKQQRENSRKVRAGNNFLSQKRKTNEKT